jgi:YbbR domain-containing protein
VGPRRILANLETNKLPVTLDLSDATVGLTDYQINEKMIHLPPGLTANVLPPDTVQFKFEVIVTKGVEVTPRLEGSPDEGYAVERVVVEPSRVEIAGAPSEVQGITQVQTEALVVTGRRESFETKAKIVVEQPHAWPSTGQENVAVRVVVTEKAVKRLLKQISLKVENPRESIRLEPSRVDVLLEGPASKMDAVGPNQVEVSVRLPEEGPLPESLPVRVRMPVEGIRANASPEKVGVKALPQQPAP